jgi:glutathione synthase
MDPITAVDIDADTTFRLAQEAQLRGHRVYYYHPENLIYNDGRVIALGNEIKIDRNSSTPIILGSEITIDLTKDIDVVWLRQDPPFDMFYITTTFLLERIKKNTLVINDPYWVRNSPEKIMILDFIDLMPPTAITRNLSSIVEFRKKHQDIILKPLYGNGGSGVFRLVPEDKNLNVFFETFTLNSREPIIIQKFLPDVSNGDKRIILVDGEPIGAINRLPPEDDIRSNMHVGGKPIKTSLTKRDIEICDALKLTLRKKKPIFRWNRCYRRLSNRNKRHITYGNPGTGTV